MIGKRIYPNEDGKMWYKEGDYGKMVDGHWFCRPPGRHMTWLRDHEVTEHEDGTITVTGSIVITDPGQSWHGYLERGIWREVWYEG